MPKSNVSSSSSDPSVNERRLRPLYEFLEASNYKRVVQEADKLLKKQPSLTRARLLKALALLRMGYVTECKGITDPLLRDKITDEGTLNTLTMCYKELGEFENVAIALENALKLVETEDLLTSLFMAYVRVGDHGKMYRSAFNLHKKYPKNTYYTWAVMSLLSRCEFEVEGDGVRPVATLGDRLISRHMSENEENETENSLILQLLILLKLKNYTQALEILQKSKEKLLLCEKRGFVFAVTLECLENSESELLTYLESSIDRNVDEWCYWEEYIGRFGVGQRERVENFILSMRAKYPNDKYSTLLAPIMHSKILIDHSLPLSPSFLPNLSAFTVMYGSCKTFYPNIESLLRALTTHYEPGLVYEILETLKKHLICKNNGENMEEESREKGGGGGEGVVKSEEEESSNITTKSLNCDKEGKNEEENEEASTESNNIALLCTKLWQGVSINIEEEIEEKSEKVECYEEVMRELNFTIVNYYLTASDRGSRRGVEQSVYEYLSKYFTIYNGAYEKGVKWAVEDMPQDNYLLLAALLLTHQFFPLCSTYSWRGRKRRGSRKKSTSTTSNTTPPITTSNVTTSNVTTSSDDTTTTSSTLSNSLNDNSNAETISTTSHENEGKNCEDLGEVKERGNGDDADVVESSGIERELEELSGSGGVEGIRLASEVSKLGGKLRLSERDLGPILALCLLQHGLERDPDSSQMRILYVKLLTRCGGASAATVLLDDLGVKNVMLETVSYLTTWRVSVGGDSRLASHLLTQLHNFYLLFETESMEQVLSAYKYGSWEKIIEFQKFRKQIVNSFQYPITKVEKSLQEYYLDPSSVSGEESLTSKLFQKAEYFDLRTKESYSPADLSKLCDSRDFVILDTLRSEPRVASWQKASFESDKKRLVLRSLLLSLLNHSLLAGREILKESGGGGGGGGGEVRRRIERIEKLLEEMEEKARVEEGEGEDTQNLTVETMWSSSVWVYINGGCLSALSSLFHLLLDLLHERKSVDESQIHEAIASLTTKVLGASFFKEFKQDPCLLDIPHLLQSVSILTETLCFATIILDVIMLVHKKILSGMKSKKKKGEEVENIKVLSRSELSKVFTTVATKLVEVEKIVKDFILIVSSHYGGNVENNAEFWSSKFNFPPLYTQVFPSAFPIVMGKLRENYLTSAGELSYILHSKCKFILKNLYDLQCFN